MPGVREDWFPTSIWYFDAEGHEGMNGQLIPLIRAEQERDGVGITDRSAVMGWHSADDLQNRPEFSSFSDLVLANALEVATFNRWDLDRFEMFIINCWAIINKRNASNVVHNHPHSVLSGVYYLQADEQSGKTFFVDPRNTPVMMMPPVTEHIPLTYHRVYYQPTPGRMLIFPAWILHGVAPNQSDEDRVILSFNIGVRYHADQTHDGGPRGR